MTGCRLNLGAGEQPLPGYANLDRKTGQEIFPLAVPDGSCDEIRASHVLEHFSHHLTGAVLSDWVRALKPGGVLKIAVPDFEYISRAYLSGADLPIQGYVMGGQVDGDDIHNSIFDAEVLVEAMKAAGLVGISRWTSEIADCASLPVSLNLMGVKPGGKPLGKICAVMSVPRLGFQDNFFCAFQSVLPLGISLSKHSGAFWDQCLTKSIEEALADGADWIMTIDYDSVFTRNQVEQLVGLAQRHPEADAVVPIQAGRMTNLPLMTIKGEDGNNMQQIETSEFDGELLRISTGHFGCTLIRGEALRQLPKPWFKGMPDSNNEWNTDKIDADIWFWRQWEKAGFSAYLANRVPIGHLELMIRWPGRDFQPMHQHSNDFWKDGPPEGIWR